MSINFVLCYFNVTSRILSTNFEVTGKVSFLSRHIICTQTIQLTMLWFISFDFHLLYLMLLQRDVENSLREFWSNWQDKNFIFGQTQYSHTATHSNTHCNTLQRTLQHKLQHNATPHQDMCLQHTAAYCNTLQHTAIKHMKVAHHTYPVMPTTSQDVYVFATRYNTLQLTATHCNTLQ